MRIALVIVAGIVVGGSGPGCKTAPAPARTGDSVVPGSGGKPMPEPAPIERMTTFELNGFSLAGAEYWPYHGTADITYPDDVLWGFYPEAGVTPPGETDPNPASARPEAVACAHTAYAALQAFLASPPAKLREIIKLGELKADVVPKFYLWVNDYGGAADPYPPGVRAARLWYWQRKEPAPPRPPGYWKWEATLTQRGQCEVPTAEQIDPYLSEMLAEMQRRVTNRPR